MLLSPRGQSQGSQAAGATSVSFDFLAEVPFTHERGSRDHQAPHVSHPRGSSQRWGCHWEATGTPVGMWSSAAAPHAQCSFAWEGGQGSWSKQELRQEEIGADVPAAEGSRALQGSIAQMGRAGISSPPWQQGEKPTFNCVKSRLGGIWCISNPRVQHSTVPRAAGRSYSSPQKCWFLRWMQGQECLFPHLSQMALFWDLICHFEMKLQCLFHVDSRSLPGSGFPVLCNL